MGVRVLTKHYALHYCHKVVKVRIQCGYDKMFTLTAKLSNYIDTYAV